MQENIKFLAFYIKMKVNEKKFNFNDLVTFEVYFEI